MSNSNAQSFEEMMKELENIVQKLDNENVSLEESLNLYQRGMKLSATCDETLKDAEKKVNELMADEHTDNNDDVVKEDNENE
ncbi:exodeoxyribonuclease VII small subunit [Staphylococcus pseudoxylosus]|uniref:exodeoxyribonuclease VII small subunit n=1 Tax=Staphylococcus pseudoxylosus TaxID=2282419 RepID=UPI000D1D8191|nr:exodeoxyribonuclease VII small subunit [Staphylococcus pseudoxylosus]PTI57015.1 exodeoxyribonuclease VII small subunit [Staphylococcus xylosus]MDW8798746.1 exodeoxyribonuclease VII small subunit [Staphylococcus pseudoxylosus]MEB6035885.1 exodeoxyribonuclease VII small subunit [Staphylococcus pseudoxylosus]MEB6045178.1 exodeoxyribonuclease VII small subunit [Staphylococcus pseudoxylosus]MEB6059864.1 exodeoxyribonuclease VII small subunit [Staphylococcus pseudoxylosus]